jgi:hypothetical protein
MWLCAQAAVQWCRNTEPAVEKVPKPGWKEMAFTA